LEVDYDWDSDLKIEFIIITGRTFKMEDKHFKLLLEDSNLLEAHYVRHAEAN